MKEQTKFRIFWALMFVGAFLVLSQRGYSDGDDAFFYRYAHEMGFFEYLGWRYQTWVGRMGGEAMVWLTFRLGLPFWRVVNALMLVLLPMGILRLANQTCVAGRGAESVNRTCRAGRPTGMQAHEPAGERTNRTCIAGRGAESVSRTCRAGRPTESVNRTYVAGAADDRTPGLLAAVTAVTGYFLMNYMTLGYAAVWVNGSIFYTWSFTCGIWALMPFAELVSAEQESAGQPECGFIRAFFGRNKMFFYSIPCAVLAAMSVEQMGAVLLAFEVIAVLYVWGKRRRIALLPVIQTLITLAAFAALFLAPGNELRVASEITHWMPEYETMPFGQHLFITLHWMISSFANENMPFLCAIWIVGGILLVYGRRAGTLPGDGHGILCRGDTAGRAGTLPGDGRGILCRGDTAGQAAGTGPGRLRRSDVILLGTAAVFAVAALLSYVGITFFSDLGMQYIGIASRIEMVPSLAAMDAKRLFAIGWWIAALLFTLMFLWRVSGRRIVVALAYLAGIASEAIMYFSPTMYASGARVYYLTDLLFLYVILTLCCGILDKRRRNAAYGTVIALGVFNFAVQIQDFLAWM